MDRSPITLFNPQQDRLFIAYSDDHLCLASQSPMNALITKDCIQELWFLALDFDLFIPGDEDNIKMITFILEKMLKLKSLVLVCGDPCESYQRPKRYYLGAITFADACNNNPISRGNAHRAKKEVEDIKPFCKNKQFSARNLIIKYKHIVRGGRKMPYWACGQW